MEKITDKPTGACRFLYWLAIFAVITLILFCTQ
jgi:hypothetical protein